MNEVNLEPENTPKLKHHCKVIWDILPVETIHQSVPRSWKRLQACVKPNIGYFEQLLKHKTANNAVFAVFHHLSLSYVSISVATGREQMGATARNRRQTRSWDLHNSDEKHAGRNWGGGGAPAVGRIRIPLYWVVTWALCTRSSALQSWTTELTA